MATVELTAQNFQQTIEAHETVIVDFWAEWCGPCRGFAPVFEKASEKHPGIVFGKVDTEAQTQLAAAFEIRAIPTLMVFKAQTIVYSDSGALPPPILERLIEQVIALDPAEIRRQAQEARAGGDEEE
jgi:thioredoxin 1